MSHCGKDRASSKSGVSQAISGCIDATRTDASYARLFSSKASDKKSPTSREILPQKPRGKKIKPDDERVMSPSGMKLDHILNARGKGGKGRTRI